MKKFLLIAFVVIIVIPILLYGIGDLIRIWNRVHVKDEFYIEYLEMHSSVSLWNGTQGFVGDVSEAYWNNDSLVVSGKKGCFLIEFGKTKYNDEMIKINCEQINTMLKQKPIEKYIKSKY